jgi:hypothetical protein
VNDATQKIKDAQTAAEVYTELVLTIRRDIGTINLRYQGFAEDFAKSPFAAIRDVDKQIENAGCEDAAYYILNQLSADDTGPAGCPGNPITLIETAVQQSTFRVMQQAKRDGGKLDDARVQTQLNRAASAAMAAYLDWNGALKVAQDKIRQLSGVPTSI